MNTFTKISLAMLAGVCGTTLAPRTQAQVSVDIGLAPDCPYGYYDYDPFDCAPYGYYGPDWFIDGLFVGAGPWFHGPEDFRGRIDSRFDRRRGFDGPLPRRGEAAEPSKHPSRMHDFRGDESHDGRGHRSEDRH